MILVPVILFPLAFIGWGVYAGVGTFAPHGVAVGFGIAAAAAGLIGWLAIKVAIARDNRRGDLYAQAYADARNDLAYMNRKNDA
jgi:hypothetical protein